MFREQQGGSLAVKTDSGLLPEFHHSALPLVHIQLSVLHVRVFMDHAVSAYIFFALNLNTIFMRHVETFVSCDPFHAACI